MTFGYGLSVGRSSICFSHSSSGCLSAVEGDTWSTSLDNSSESVEGGDRDAKREPEDSPSPFRSIVAKGGLWMTGNLFEAASSAVSTPPVSNFSAMSSLMTSGENW